MSTGGKTTDRRTPEVLGGNLTRCHKFRND